MAALQINQLFAKEVDRKEFLIYVVFIVLTITGITGIMKNIATLSQGKQQKGFGSNTYGK